MRVFTLVVTSLLCALAHANPTRTKGQLQPTSVESSPNPIGTLYPTSVSGSINGTIAVVPIPYSLARSIVPAQYGILQKAYKSILPGFPTDSYPLIIRSVLDHDVGVDGVALVDDFQSIHIFYPFIDLLGDGYSSFVYEKYLIMTSTNTLAQQGAEAYGQFAVPATFVPENNSYAFTHPLGKGRQSGEICLEAYTNVSDNAAVTTKFVPLPGIGPWPFEFYVNVTNQPIFGNGVNCDQQVTYFNTTLSEGKNTPVGLVGDISVLAPYLPTDRVFKGVYGLKVDIAFIENNFLNCSSVNGL